MLPAGWLRTLLRRNQSLLQNSKPEGHRDGREGSSETSTTHNASFHLAPVSVTPEA